AINVPDGPTGMHLVTYTPSAPADSSTFIDQAVNFLVWSDWPYPSALTDSLVQTFRAGSDGRFTQVQLLLHDATPNTYALKLYRGVAPNTTLLATTIVNTVVPDTAWVTFPLAGQVPVIEGQQYTLELTAEHAVRLMISQGGGSAISDYIPGISNLVNPNADAVFRTWVYAVPPCPMAVRYFEVYDPPTYPVPSLAHTYCPDEAEAIPLIGSAPGATNSHFVLDGTAITSFVPASLSEGPHALAFVNTTFGCTDTSAYTFNVARPVSVIDGLDAPVCLPGPAIPLTATPAGGSFTIDGVFAVDVDPMVLGVGPHTVVHTFNGAVDSVAFREQSCCGNELARFSDYTTLPPNGAFWQTFVPAFSGRLDSVSFVIAADQIRTYRYAVRVHEGEGLNGTLLGSDTVQYSTWNASPNFIGDIHPDVQAGQPYTVHVERLPDTVSVDPYVFHYRANSYPAGAASLNAIEDVDLYFVEYVSTTYGCQGITEVPFTVEVCTGITEPESLDLTIAPNPFNEAFTLRAATDVRYTLLNSLGQAVLHGRANANTPVSVDANGLAAGTYLLRCTDAHGSVYTRVLVRMR
ncbi:MAG TPA: T9SS type A sorting domain-containing protein, partial [Flavobacteriales bacterium]|nr:T9SS type A sorting domain-containing protein [Flavobacteriales bacterium]